LERLHFADRQKHGDLLSLGGLFEALTNFQAAVAWHIYVEYDQVGLALVDLLERSRPVVDGNDLVAGIHENAAAHVLGGYAVIGKQYGARQGLSFGKKGRSARR